MYYVYILRSSKDKRHYIGYTDNLDRRLAEHNRGKSRSIRNRAPFELIKKELYFTELDAKKRERQIKSFKGGEAFKRLVRKSDPIV